MPPPTGPDGARGPPDRGARGPRHKNRHVVWARPRVLHPDGKKFGTGTNTKKNRRRRKDADNQKMFRARGTGKNNGETWRSLITLKSQANLLFPLRDRKVAGRRGRRCRRNGVPRRCQGGLELKSNYWPNRQIGPSETTAKTLSADGGYGAQPWDQPLPTQQNLKAGVLLDQSARH